MRLPLVLWITLLVVAVSFAGCGNSGGAPPSEPELFADPEVCDVPCEVVIDSGIEPTGKDLTFTWDVGEGPIEGLERFLYRFDSAGAYEITLTVKDGDRMATDTVRILAEPQATTSKAIDTAGGTVSQGSGSVTLPAKLTPQDVTVELTELPSMQNAAERVLGVGRFTALGKAYRVSMPLKSEDAIEIAVKDPGAAGKDPKDLGWLVRLVGKPVTTPPEDERPPRARAPWAAYVVLPVTRIDADGTAHGEIYAREQFQLVELTAPLEVESFDIDEASPSPGLVADKAAAKAPAAPVPPILLFWNKPPYLDAAKFADAAREGVRESYEVLVRRMGFAPPKGQLKVIVGAAPGPTSVGFVSFDEPLTIYLAHKITNEELVMKAIAHEFFHLIQNASENESSVDTYGAQDSWFAEGTADWAMDEVFDAFHNRYHAMKWRRFTKPLNTDTGVGDEDYQTCAFWKWAEEYRSGVIREVIEHKYGLTHTTQAGSRTAVESSTAHDYLTSFKAVWRDVDFLTFVYDARYEKEFETDENRFKELWDDDPYLGSQPRQVLLEEKNVDTVADQVSGHDESNPITLPFALAGHLTAEAFRVENLDMQGNLRIKLPVTQGRPIDAHVLVTDLKAGTLEEEKIVRDLSKSHPDTKVKFDPDKEVIIFVADGQWLPPTTAASTKGEIKVWMEDPCGELPSEVIDLTPDDDLFVALTTAPAGSAVRLGPGTYQPPLTQWPTPEFGPFGANVLVKDLTLIGAGEGQTRIVMTGDPYGGIGLKTYGNATLRNFTIVAGQSEPAIDCLDAKRVTMCNVTVEASSSTDFGIIWGPWHGGATSLTLRDCTLAHPNREQMGTAIQLQSCYEPPATVWAELSLTRVSGWGIGVSYDTGPEVCGSISVTADCDGFTNNDYNVLESACSGGSCDFIEHCPSP